MSFVRVLGLAVVAVLGGCSAAPAAPTGKGQPNTATDPNDPAKAGGFGSSDSPPSPSPSAAGADQPAEVWGHSADTLYRVDATTKAVTVVGVFSGCTGVTDIALDASSKIYATTLDSLWTIDKTTAACTKIADGDYPNSLSFVPQGTIDPNAEALVGYDGSDYLRIDTATGVTTQLGSLGDDLESSGDIVSVKGGSTYLTVTGGSDCSEFDCLVEVDAKTGALVKNWGSTGHADVYGLAFWAGSVYGFDDAGELFELTFDGGKLATQAIPIPPAAQTPSFWGAGSTTSAPVTAVK